MAWVYLIIGGIFEVVWAVSMKYSEGFTKMLPSAITVIGMILSIIFLSIALKMLPLGTAYAVWTGIGAVGTVIMGIILFKEPQNISRLLFITMIITSIAGLKLTSSN
jgi:Membrane transporters of cations and cationic drugs